jgi:NAD+ synthase (glutamine-hydrolysing)
MQINYLAEEMNSILGREVIPSNLIARIRKGIPFYELHPTAELKTNQIDPMKWGYHDWLLNRLMSFPTRDISQLLTDYEQSNLPEEVVNLLKYYHLDNEEAFIADLKWFLKTLDNSYFKRIQMPPIVTISRGSFGFDYRETQAKIEEFIEQLK